SGHGARRSPPPRTPRRVGNSDQGPKAWAGPRPCAAAARVPTGRSESGAGGFAGPDSPLGLGAQPLVLDLPLQLMQRAADVTPQGRAGDPLGEQSDEPCSGDAVLIAQLDSRAAIRERPDPPAAALVDPGDR